MRSGVESLHLRGVRQFNELNVHFNDRFNFIVGPNGCGKTSVLAAISHCFSVDYQYSRFRDDAEFWIDLTFNEIKYRIGLGQGGMNIGGYRGTQVRSWINPPFAEGRNSIPVYRSKDLLNSFAPLFIGAQRNIKYKQLAGVQRELDREQSINQYFSNSTMSLYGDWQTDVKQWFVNRYFMIDKDWAHEERINWWHLIGNLPHIGPFDSDFTYVRTGRDLEPVFSIYGKECYLEEVSSGFQAVLLIIANIIEWIEGSREAGNRIVQNAAGTVLIDELDIHLHPEWQFTIRSGLARLFPNIQFIVTTHSPHLLASAKENEVIVMPGRIADINVCNLSPSPQSFAGWNTDQILSEVMGVKSLENKTYEKLVSEALNFADNGNVNGLGTAIKNLQVVCHPNDTILVVLKARLATLELN
jgi:energy-coupling factor transporter ATP-binding protein EcfA2